MTVHETAQTSRPFEAEWAVKGGAVAGVVAAAITAVALVAVDLPTLRQVIAGLYGAEGSLAVGLLAHLFHGATFGVLFAAVLSDPVLYRVSDEPLRCFAAGVVFAVVLAVVGAGIIMPIWLGLVGFADPPALPNVTAPMLTWHLLYGIVLGAAFPLASDL